MVTSKLQLAVPKAIADQFGIEPGDELHMDWGVFEGSRAALTDWIRGGYGSGGMLTLVSRACGLRAAALPSNKRAKAIRRRASTSCPTGSRPSPFCCKTHRYFA